MSHTNGAKCCWLNDSKKSDVRKNNKDAFFTLLRAGLWGDGNSDIRIEGTTGWNYVYQLAQEQSVQGVVLQGIDSFRFQVPGFKIPQVLLLQWIGELQEVEQRNKAMNAFIAGLVEKLRKTNVYALLIKGQGVAQCYDKPLWRSSGDVDLLLDSTHYEKAKSLFIPIAESVNDEDIKKKEIAITIKGIVVELHGCIPFAMSKRVDDGIDKVLEDLFFHGNVRSWDCNGTQVFLPSPDNDVILVYTHFLHHFFIEGVGFRQICDWCRLMWTYRDSLNYGLLESMIRKMGLMSEWKAFYNLASRYLGMPDLDSRFMVHDSRFDKKADRIMGLVLKSGNFGHNKDLSYRTRYSGLTYKFVAAWRRLKDFASLIPVFPMDAPKFFFTYLFNKAK